MLREIGELKVQTSTGDYSVRHPRTKDWFTVKSEGLSGIWHDLVGFDPPSKAWVENRRDLVVDNEWLRRFIAAERKIPEIRTIMVRKSVATDEMLAELRSSLPNVSVIPLEDIPGPIWRRRR